MLRNQRSEIQKARKMHAIHIRFIGKKQFKFIVSDLGLYHIR
ncbi:hypothetical protein LptCag_0477 [Leptospirillum ferriphilum]|uniref:Uncharacterized protein n=1 Tax=Leptospirillum ferriphilum TaxID=178606 RepID=A0A094WAQ1_9BACT|nr:hypothetical protein LptCag_0477 [Leptospirillum ferriphilum]